MDLLVEWNNGDKNVVKLSDVKLDGPLRKEVTLSMWWEPEHKWYEGKVLDFEFAADDEDVNEGDLSSDDENVPLSL